MALFSEIWSRVQGKAKETQKGLNLRECPAVSSSRTRQKWDAWHWLGEGWGCRLPPPLPPKMCPGGLAYQDGTSHNEQGRRTTTDGLQSINPTSALAQLRTCCCFCIVLHFLPLFFFFYYYSIYIVSHSVLTHPKFSTCMLACYHTSPSGTTIIHARVVPLPAFCTYVTPHCTQDHNSLKWALDWAETSEGFYPWHPFHLIPG